MSDPAVANRPATFHDVLAHREYRAVFAGSTLSWLGDNAARAAVTALVFQRTDSVAYSAATFAISYLPWLGIGPVLAAVAERYPYRRVMILCDVLRLGLMALIAVPGLNVPTMIALLFATALLNPPFEAARSALLPQLLTGDRYIVGISLQKTAAQSAMIFGYVSGANLATLDARIAVLFNAGTFGFSAIAVCCGVRTRAPALATSHRSGIIRETREGFTVVFRAPLLRAIAILTFLCAFFSILPEGLAAGWAANLTPSAAERGWYQAIIMISNPVGFIVGGVLIGRFTAPTNRIKLIKPFAVLAPLVLVPSLFHPSVYGVTAMNAAVGFFVSGLLPAVNGLFVQALGKAFRARAFGVMQSGLQLVQGTAVLAGGALSDNFELPSVVGAWATVGVVVMILVTRAWPSPQAIHEEIAKAQHANRADTEGQPAPVQ